MKPKTLQIGGRNYAIIRDDLLGQYGLLGQHRPASREIAINMIGGDSIALTATFLHEIVEAINDVWLDSRLDHLTINSIGEALYQAFAQLGLDIDWSEE